MFRRMLLAVIALVVFAGLPAIASATTLTVQATGPNGTAGPFYTDSGVNVPGGGSVTVTATGLWSLCGPSACFVGPDGNLADHNPSNLLPSAGAGALIGSLDGAQTWFLIGGGPTAINGPGELILSENGPSPTAYGTCGFDPVEGCFGTVTGSMNVTITANRTFPNTKDQCKNNGWQSLSDSKGTTFKNQGDCVSYVATGGKSSFG